MFNRKFNDQEIVRRNKVREMISNGIKPYANRKDFSHTSLEIQKFLKQYTREELEFKNVEISTIGRIITKRGPFIVLLGQDDNIQCYYSKKENEKLAKFIDYLDIGDIVWVCGVGMKTKTDVPTIHLSSIELLSKSLHPLPNKFHSLTNKEEKQRKRYLDLIMNHQTKERFIKRTKILKWIRKYFDDLNYLEVDTPILQSILGGASAKPFITKHNALNMNFYLRIATELPLKQLIVGGFNRVYEIGRLFRNEGVDATHNPEFTTIEFYEANSDLKGMMERTEKLFSFICENLDISEIEYNGDVINFSIPFKTITMRDAIKEKTGVDFHKIEGIKEAKEIADFHNIKYEKYHSIGHIVNLFFEEFVERRMIQPTFITEFPIEISPLAAKIEGNDEYTLRAELFINGREYANMFTELSDPIDQYNRFLMQLKEKHAGNDEASEMDMNFVTALEYGMPPTGGCGIGIDRIIMLFTQSNNISDVILFPHLKNKGNK